MLNGTSHLDKTIVVPVTQIGSQYNITEYSEGNQMGCQPCWVSLANAHFTFMMDKCSAGLLVDLLFVVE
jgi:hypothetical protein